jgi:hypothetical protein
MAIEIHCEGRFMKYRIIISLSVLFLSISALFVPLPQSPDELLGLDIEKPQWLVDVAWIPNLKDPDNIEYCAFTQAGRGVWTPTHADSSKAIQFRYKMEEQRGKNKHAVRVEFEDGSKALLPFTHEEGRFKLNHPNGTVVFKHKISFKKTPFKGSSKVFYGHPERRG